MYYIDAKFKSVCSETGRPIKKGERCLYSKEDKKIFCSQSKAYTDHSESKNLHNFIDDQENAFFDNFCAANNC